jgi:hypothetical protein
MSIKCTHKAFPRYRLERKLHFCTCKFSGAAGLPPPTATEFVTPRFQGFEMGPTKVSVTRLSYSP